MNKHLTIEQKVSRARTQLLLNQPFFGTLCLRLKLVAATDFASMATNGRLLVYNPAFVEKLTPAELEGVLAHEVMHCALSHHCRRGEREAQLWNQAADYAINPILISNGITLPKDALLDPSFADLSAEEIYARLLKQGRPSRQPQSPQPSGTQPSAGCSGSSSGQTPPAAPLTPQQSATSQPEQQPQLPGVSEQALESRAGGFGEVLDAVGEDDQPASQAELSRQMHEWAINAQQALCSAKACGREPSGIERPLEQARKSEQDWRALLRDFIAATNPSDYRWAPPNRRFVSSGLYLPSVERNGVGEIVVIVDTSGSIGSKELEQFAGEITAISEEAEPELVRVIYCDAAVQAIEEFGPSEPIKLLPQGGGGTDFVPPFRCRSASSTSPICVAVRIRRRRIIPCCGSPTRIRRHHLEKPFGSPVFRSNARSWESTLRSQLNAAWLFSPEGSCCRLPAGFSVHPETQRWLAFLRNPREATATMDLLSVLTVTFGILFGCFVSAHDRRRIRRDLSLFSVKLFSPKNHKELHGRGLSRRNLESKTGKLFV